MSRDITLTDENSAITANSRLRSKLPAILALALFFLVAAILTWPRVPELATSVVDHGDPLHHIWRLDWIDRTLFTDYSHLYDAPIYHGFPLALAYDDIFIGPALFVGALTALTQNIDLSYNILIVLEFVLAAWSVFLLARHVTGSTIGGLFAGMIVGFTSYTFAHLSHMNLLAIYPMPLALLCLHQVFDAPSRAMPGPNKLLKPGLWVLMFLACAIWQALHSFYYAAYLALAGGGLTLWEVLIVRRWRLWAGRSRAVVAILLAGAWVVYLISVWLLSVPNRAVQQEFGFRRSLEDQIFMSANLSDYFAISLRNNTYAKVLPIVDLDQALFPGFIALLLGGVGLGFLLLRIQGQKRDTGLHGGETSKLDNAGISRSRVRFYLLLAIVGIVLSLGPVWDTGGGTLPLPYQLFWSLPGFEGLRGPRRFAVLSLLGWGVLAAWGWRGISRLVLDRAGRRVPMALAVSSSSEQIPVQVQDITQLRSAPGAIKAGLGALAVVLLALMGIEQWSVPTPSAPLPPEPYLFPQQGVPPAYNWLAEQKDNGVLMEFPVRPGDATRDFPIMYYQKIHHHPLVNGLSSYQPEMYLDIMSRLDIAQYPLAGFDFTSAQIGMLQSLEVRYLMFNELAYKVQHWQRIQSSLAKYPEVKFVGQYGGHYIYELAPLNDAARPRIGWRGPTTEPAGASMPITITIVNPYSYMLLTRLQPSLDLVVNWEREEGTPAAAGKPGDDGKPGLWQSAAAPFPIQSIYYSSLLNGPFTARTELTVDADLLVTQGAHLFNTRITTPREPGKYLLQIYPKWVLPRYKVAAPTEVTVTAAP